MQDTNETGDQMLARLPQHEVLAMLAGSATELARRWLEASKAGAYVNAGWGTAVEIKLLPAPASVSISFIDPSDLKRYPHATFDLDKPNGSACIALFN